jgi:hypothetical protein
MGVVFGRQLDLQNIRQFAKDLLGENIIAEDQPETICGQTSIIKNQIESINSMNENFVLIGALGKLIMNNLENLEINQFNEKEFECIVISVLKTVKKIIKTPANLNEAEIFDRLKQFVEINEGRTFMVIFNTSAED